MKKRYIHIPVITGAMFFILLAAPFSAQSELNIARAIFYTDNFGPNPFGWDEGHHFVVCAEVSGYENPANDGKVYAKDENDVEMLLNHDWGNWFCRFVVSPQQQGGVMTIRAVDKEGNEATGNTCDLDNIIQIPLAENIRYSDKGSSLVIEWDQVEHAEFYFVRFYFYDQETVSYQEQRGCRSNSLEEPFYVIPGSSTYCIIDLNSHFVVRILSTHLDECDSGRRVENRSSTWGTFIPPSGIRRYHRKP